MKRLTFRFSWRQLAPSLVCLALILILLWIPTGYEDAVIYQESAHCAALVLDTDESTLIDTGLIRSGEQLCTLRLLGTSFEGQITTGVNLLTGSLTQDKLFEPGDRALVLVNASGGQIRSVSMIDHYRLPGELWLAGLFALLLLVFAGSTGLRALLSFVMTVLMIWKVLVPAFLNGVNPVWAGLAMTVTLCVMVVLLVFGFDRRAGAAIAGCTLGVAVTCVMGVVFTDLFRIHGAVMENAESLLYNGYAHLNLTQIFMAGIFIGASGAVMDLAVDIASAVGEVVQKSPDISRWAAVRSGMTVGRAALATQTTTLLLAYSGGYMALLMSFMAQGTPIYAIFNLKYVAAEILHTLVGSFGLCAVAPLTALTSGLLLTGRGNSQKARSI